MATGNKQGFSLLELLVVLSLITITALWIIPTYKTSLTQSEDHILSTQLLHAINTARNEAITRGIPITLCQSAHHEICSGQWQDGQVILIDDEPNTEKTILYVFDRTFPGILHWRSSLKHNYLRLLPAGEAEENGTFWYCHQNEKYPAWKIVVNKSGRPRLVNQLDSNLFPC
jgi:type IV fimbrial biogenesis protein FimT